MKTAVIISGQARTFDICFPSQRWQVYRHYEPDLHFFVTVKDDEDADKMEVLRQYSKNVSIQKLPDPEDLWMPPEDAGRFAPYSNAASNKQLMLQHWSNKEAYNFFVRNANEEDALFEEIIRIRTDSFFHSFNKPHNQWKSECATPWWGRFGGINDRFSIMGPVAANSYFSVYDNIPELIDNGCPFHPESLVMASLQTEKIKVSRDLHATFSTIRKNGQQRPPEIMLEDLADLSL